MPKWILICQNCGTEFQHSQIDDVGMFSYLLSIETRNPAWDYVRLP
jgi:hypothetical protein